MKKCLTATVAAMLIAGIAPAALAGIIYQENFTGLGTAALNGKAPDIDNNGGTNAWLAYGNYKQNGATPSDNVSQGAWLPFTPAAGNVYTLTASFAGVGQDGTSVAWYALGFAKGLPTAASAASPSGQNRFNEGVTAGRAWMHFRPNNPTTPTDAPNVSHLGNTTTGTASNITWTDSTLARAEGGDIDLKIVLDTNAATWTADFFAKRPADSSYAEVSAGPLNLIAQDILGVGIARTTNSPAGTTLTGTVTHFELSVVPEPASCVLLVLGLISLGLSRRKA